MRDVFPHDGGRPEGIYYRPKVIFNNQTGKFVLWINFLPPAPTPLAAYPNATILVATSTDPSGLFTVVTPSANIEHKGSGDLTLMVDSATGDAFVAYVAGSYLHTHTYSLVLSSLQCAIISHTLTHVPLHAASPCSKFGLILVFARARMRL